MSTALTSTWVIPSVLCRPDEIVTGGGFTIESPANPTGVVVLGNGPTVAAAGKPNGWQVSVRAAEVIRVRLRAMCAPM